MLMEESTMWILPWQKTAAAPSYTTEILTIRKSSAVKEEKAIIETNFNSNTYETQITYCRFVVHCCV